MAQKSALKMARVYRAAPSSSQLALVLLLDVHVDALREAAAAALAAAAEAAGAVGPWSGKDGAGPHHAGPSAHM